MSNYKYTVRGVLIDSEGEQKNLTYCTQANAAEANVAIAQLMALAERKPEIGIPIPNLTKIEILLSHNI